MSLATSKLRVHTESPALGGVQENLCTPTPSPILSRFVGLYDLRETPSGRYEAVRDAPWENSAEDDESFRGNAEGHNAAVDAKASEPERRWQLRVHQEFCKQPRYR